MYNTKSLLLLFTIQSLTLSSTTGQEVCETECGSRLFMGFTVTVNGRCKPSNYLAKVTDTATHACHLCLYQHTNPGTTVATIDDAIQEICLAGYAEQTFPFSNITQRGYEFDNEHYAGGGEWNYEIETASGEDVLQYDASRVNDVFYYEAQRKVIEFPEYLESFNPSAGHTIDTIEDLDGCDMNAAYCCFAQDRQAGDNNGNCATPYEYNCVDKDPADNTNICYIDHARSAKSSHVGSGFSIFGDLQTNKENIEGSVHCHGFAWGDDPLHTDSVYKGNLFFYVSMYDHLTQRGYARNIPGSPMCACAENMAVVTRADCTQIAANEQTKIVWSPDTNTLVANVNIKDLNFNACTGTPNNNNLEDRMRRLNNDGHVGAEKLAAIKEVLVGSQAGKCNAAIEGFLNERGITKITSTSTS